MTDEQPCGVMKMAAKAAAVVSSWSTTKQEFARRAINHGSFSGARCITPSRLHGAYIKDDGDAA